MTGPKPLPKRALHIVRSRASSFKLEYPLISLRSSSSFLRLLPRLPVTSIPPFIFPSITRWRRQFLRKMWPIQFACRLHISCRMFLCSLTLSLSDDNKIILQTGHDSTFPDIFYYITHCYIFYTEFVWRVFQFVCALPRQSSTVLCSNIQCVPLATEPGISLIIRKPMKISQRNLYRSTFFSFTFLTQWGKSASNFVAISSLVVKLLKKCRVR